MADLIHPPASPSSILPHPPVQVSALRRTLLENHQLLLARLQRFRDVHLPHTRFSSYFHRGHGFRDSIGPNAIPTSLFVWLRSTLLSYLRIGFRWMAILAALALYAIFVLPGVIRVGWSYFFDKRIQRGIIYGKGSRNRLDLFLPKDLTTPKPVLAFVGGGAWIIGYKAWGSLLGLQLVDADVIVACLDYRNYPQGTISDMVEDISEGISFICENIANYGGDTNRLYLVGQSAGAQIAACALVEQAKKQIVRGDVETASQQHETLPWTASQFQAYIGLSGGYNLFKLMSYFHSKGFSKALFLSIMEGEVSMLRYSPELSVQSLLGTKAGSLLPHIYLFHGDRDSSMPCELSISFEEALTSIGVEVTAKIYEGKTHTDLFLHDPMRGGYDAVLADILAVVYGEERVHRAKEFSTYARRRMVPEVFLRFARKVSPF